MENWNEFVKISEKENSPIEIGHSIVVDGHVEGKKNAVFTHFHEDHIECFDDVTSSSYNQIFLHDITYQVMIALKNSRKFMRQIKPMQHGILGTRETKLGEKITLYDADHIPGSSQVLVEVDNTRILYSGDFVFPSAATPKCDILILDASHGSPQFTTNTDIDSEMNSLLFEMKGQMKEVIEEKIVVDKKPIVVSAPRGTLQEMMKFLDEGNGEINFSYDVPFIAREKDITILNALYPDSKSNRKFLEWKSPQAYRKIKNKSPCIIFTPNLPSGELLNMYRVIEGRYPNFKNEPALSEHGNTLRINLSSHGSYEKILDYVKKNEPEMIITDSSRSKFSEELAKNLTKEYGKAAISLP
tara:strand:- start:2739 stop:3809 length:1071 start_codon:yes stop_codon:yes gene_type:complete